MKLKLVTVGRSAPKWADASVEEFAKRLRRFGGLQEIHLKPEKFKGDIEAVRSAEGKRILDQLGPRDTLVTLDERGEALKTEQFAELLDEGLVRGGALVFAIGGPYGHDPSVRKRAWRTVRLSTMVMNHQVARIVLVEQIYRAFTVLKGIPYHH